MKKIFAIALALVMVLSMASAFASQCNVGPYTWGCATSTTNCAKATVEVIPYVKSNDSCDTVTYVQSDCAAAVNGENVYFALKMVVPADIDREWLNGADLTLEIKGMESVNGKKAIEGIKFVDGFEKTIDLPAAEIDALMAYFGDAHEDGYELYYVLNGKADATDKWFEATEDADFDIADVMNKAVVKSYAKAKVCATLESKNEFSKATVGDYTVEYVTDINPSGDYKDYEAVLKITGDNGVVRLCMDAKDKVQKIVASDLENCATEASLINEVLAAFNLGCGYGVCITADDVAANFGWDDEVKSCFAWKTNATAIVDAECVVAIPKTGDASVLAWLF